MGAPKEKLQILALSETDGVFSWREAGEIWASVTLESKANLFSRVGIGARSAAIVTVPRPDLTLFAALRWRGEHLFLTEMFDRGPARLEIRAARVTPRGCTAFRAVKSADRSKPAAYETRKIMRFPACVTEKWMGFAQREPQGELSETVVLVTPKAVDLKIGDVVEVEGLGRYAVRVPHRLDEYKNEFEAAKIQEA